MGGNRPNQAVDKSKPKIPGYHGDASDYRKTVCGVGACEILGRRGSQEDRMEIGTATQLAALPKLNDKAIESSFTEAFAQLESRVRDLGRQSDQCGSTCVCAAAWVDPATKQLTTCTANVGDSEAILVVIRKDGTVEQRRLNTLHNAADAGEVARVGSENISDEGRLGGELAITRAFGDHSLDGANVGHAPDVKVDRTITLADGDRAFVVVGCDGLTDNVANDDKAKKNAPAAIAKTLAENLAEDKDKSPELIAQSLVSEAYSQRQSRDNISCSVFEVTGHPTSVVVCDGHGGEAVSQLVGEHFFSTVQNRLDHALANQANLQPAQSQPAASPEAVLSATSRAQNAVALPLEYYGILKSADSWCEKIFSNDNHYDGPDNWTPLINIVLTRDYPNSNEAFKLVLAHALKTLGRQLTFQDPVIQARYTALKALDTSPVASALAERDARQAESKKASAASQVEPRAADRLPRPLRAIANLLNPVNDPSKTDFNNKKQFPPVPSVMKLSDTDVLKQKLPNAQNQKIMQEAAKTDASIALYAARVFVVAFRQRPDYSVETLTKAVDNYLGIMRMNPDSATKEEIQKSARYLVNAFVVDAEAKPSLLQKIDEVAGPRQTVPEPTSVNQNAQNVEVIQPLAVNPAVSIPAQDNPKKDDDKPKPQAAIPTFTVTGPDGNPAPVKEAEETTRSSLGPPPVEAPPAPPVSLPSVSPEMIAFMNTQNTVLALRKELTSLTEQAGNLQLSLEQRIDLLQKAIDKNAEIGRVLMEVKNLDPVSMISIDESKAIFETDLAKLSGAMSNLQEKKKERDQPYDEMPTPKQSAAKAPEPPYDKMPPNAPKVLSAAEKTQERKEQLTESFANFQKNAVKLFAAKSLHAREEIIGKLGKLSVDGKKAFQAYEKLRNEVEEVAGSLVFNEREKQNARAGNSMLIDVTNKQREAALNNYSNMNKLYTETIKPQFVDVQKAVMDALSPDSKKWLQKIIQHRTETSVNLPSDFLSLDHMDGFGGLNKKDAKAMCDSLDGELSKICGANKQLYLNSLRDVTRMENYLAHAPQYNALLAPPVKQQNNEPILEERLRQEEAAARQKAVETKANKAPAGNGENPPAPPSMSKATGEVVANAVKAEEVTYGGRTAKDIVAEFASVSYDLRNPKITLSNSEMKKEMHRLVDKYKELENIIKIIAATPGEEQSRAAILLSRECAEKSAFAANEFQKKQKPVIDKMEKNLKNLQKDMEKELHKIYMTHKDDKLLSPEFRREDPLAYGAMVDKVATKEFKTLKAQITLAEKELVAEKAKTSDEMKMQDTKAFAYASRAVAAGGPGSLAAMYDLAVMHDQGKGTEKNINETKRLFKEIMNKPTEGSKGVVDLQGAVSKYLRTHPAALDDELSGLIRNKKASALSAVAGVFQQTPEPAETLKFKR